jgi:outer membrane protein assembly factor BamB
MEPFWRQALGGAVIGLPTAQAGSVVMVCEGGMLKAYSWQGNPLWTYYVRGRLAPFVTRSPEGTSYVSRTNGTLIAINRVGRELWQIDPGGPLAAPVLTGWDGRLFVFTQRRLSSYTAAGCPLWQAALASPPLLPPEMDLRGGFITVLENGDILRFNPFGAVRARRLWELPSAAVSLHLPGERELSILLAYPSGAMEIWGEYLDSPHRALKTALPGRPLAAVVRGGNVALTLGDGRVVLVDPASGEIRWTAESHIAAGEFAGRDRAGGEDIAMIGDERGIYVLTKTGATGFADDGQRLWSLRLNNSPALPAFSDEGVLYAGGRDWILYAYRPEERVRAQKYEVYGPAPEGSYGAGTPPPSSWADYPYRFNEAEMRGRLGKIEEDLRRGRVGPDEQEYTAYLMEVAGSYPYPGPAASPPVHVPYRAEAARLLGFFGSREIIPFLTNLFIRDPDGTVKAAAAGAIGRIGVDPAGLAIRAFTNAVFPPAPMHDEEVLAAVAAATGALCRFSGPPLADAGVRILSALSMDTRPPVVRGQARRELQSLGGRTAP